MTLFFPLNSDRNESQRPKRSRDQFEFINPSEPINHRKRFRQNVTTEIFQENPYRPKQWNSFRKRIRDDVQIDTQEIKKRKYNEKPSENMRRSVLHKKENNFSQDMDIDMNNNNKDDANSMALTIYKPKPRYGPRLPIQNISSVHQYPYPYSANVVNSGAIALRNIEHQISDPTPPPQSTALVLWKGNNRKSIKVQETGMEYRYQSNANGVEIEMLD